MSERKLLYRFGDELVLIGMLIYILDVIVNNTVKPLTVKDLK